MDNTAEINDCTFNKTLNISITISIPKSASTVKWPRRLGMSKLNKGDNS